MSTEDDFPDTYEPLFPTRYKRFQDAFPAKEYAIRISHELLDKEQLELLIRADPAKAAEQIIEAYQAPAFLFRADLVHVESDNVIQTAHAARRVFNYKDYEVGETAARQRVVAAAGFDGHIMLEDEVIDASDQGQSDRTAVTTAESDQPDERHLAETNQEDESQDPGDRPEPANDCSKDVPKANPSMVNQIRQYDKRKGLNLDIRDDMSHAEAREMLKYAMTAQAAAS